jgi:threonine/homoserine/homoserine lactone efflux protein
MIELNLLIRGIIAGLVIAAPVGPVNVLCMQRAISRGWKAGVITGFGAALADTVYGGIAGFSISFVIALLIRELFWIRLFGGILLIGIGIAYLRREHQHINTGSQNGSAPSAFLLTLMNPTTVLSFLAILAALRMEGHRPWWQTVFVVGGIFLGSMTWWVILSATVNHFRQKINDRTMVWMDRIAGAALGGFGVLTLALARKGF